MLRLAFLLHLEWRSLRRGYRRWRFARRRRASIAPGRIDFTDLVQPPSVIIPMRPTRNALYLAEQFAERDRRAAEYEQQWLAAHPRSGV